MDNRDRNVVCPFYRPGSKHATNSPREKGKRKRTINCQGEQHRHTIEFKSVEERTEHNKRYCKCAFARCPFYQNIVQVDEMIEKKKGTH